MVCVRACGHAYLSVLVGYVSFPPNVHAGVHACSRKFVRVCVRAYVRTHMCVTYLLHCTGALLIAHDSKDLKASSHSYRRTTRVCVCVCVCAIELLSPSGQQPTCTKPGAESV